MKSTSIVEAGLVGLGALGVFLVGIINLDNVPPPSFDEGWTLCVARQWVENGHYGCLFLGEFGPPYNSAHFPVVVPIALSFRIFGVGIWQARIVGLTFTVIDLILIYFLTRRLFNRRIAIGAAILALLHPVWNIQLLFLGRQVIGEIPAVFYLLAGCICFLYAQQKPWAAIPFTILFWGIALLTKKQVFPFWAAALAITLALVLARRQWRLGSVIAAAMIGSYAASSILNAMKRLLLIGHTLPHPPMEGQLQAQALVVDPDIRWATLKVALTFGLPTLLGLGYAAWKLTNSHRIQEAGSSHEATKLILFLLASGWLGWYALLSIGWERYAFPPLFLGNPFLAVLIYDATGGYSPQFVIKAARSVVANRRVNWQAITAAFVLAIPAYADCQPSTPTAGDDNIVCNGSDTNGVTGGGGNDTINTNGADVSGPVAVDGGAGNDIVTVDGGTVIGLVGVNGGTGNDTITVDNGAAVDGIIGVNGGMGNDTITVSDANVSGLLIGVFGNTGQDNITIASGAEVSGMLVAVGAGADDDVVTVESGATVTGDAFGVSTGAELIATPSGNDIVVNDGTVSGGFAAIATWDGNDTVALGNDSVTNGNILVGDGNDTVNVGSAIVIETTVCGDVRATAVYTGSPTVNGLIDGGNDTDTIVFGYGVDRSQYAYQEFENIEDQVVEHGATRLYDDGVVLAFTSRDGNGIDVCSGPNGWRVATIDFGTLSANANDQQFSAGNEGWFATVTTLGGGQYQVRVFDGSGALQNDQFIFTH